MGTQSWAQDDPKCSEGAKKKSKNSLLGAKSVAFTCEIRESGPLLKHQQGLCFHHIMRSGPFPFCSETRFGNALRTGNTFFHGFCSRFGAQVRPKAAQGRPKAFERTPKASPGTRKIHQKSNWDPSLVFKAAREAPGVPPGRQMTAKSTKKR
jgi:hypothetical protein